MAGIFAAIGPDAASNLVFSAAMDGTQQMPPNDSPATGTASLLLSPDQTQVVQRHPPLVHLWSSRLAC